MRQIPLTQGKFAKVDDEDFEWLSQWKWYALKHGNTFFAARDSNGTQILMHDEIMRRQLN